MKSLLLCMHEVRKRAKIRDRYNQASHLTQDTNGKVTTSQQDITNKGQEQSDLGAYCLQTRLHKNISR